MNSKRIIIFGSNSYIARNFCYYVKNLERNDYYYLIGYSLSENINPYLDEFHQMDLSKTFIEIECNNFYVNFASYSHVDYSFQNPMKILKNNIGIAKNIIIEVNKKFNYDFKNNFIHISTDEVEVEGGPTSPYSWSKLAQEVILHDKVKIVRLNNVYGKESDYDDLEPKQPIIWHQLNRLRNGEIDKIDLVANYTEITRNFMPVHEVSKYLFKNACKFFNDPLDFDAQALRRSKGDDAQALRRSKNDEVIKSVIKNTEPDKLYKGYTRTIAKFIKDYMKKYNYFNYSLKFKIVENRPKTDWSYPVGLKTVSKEKYLKYL